jgi:hypothetical protein
MPFNLLLLPLIGGYYLLVTSRFTKYIHQRIDRQRLIFNSVLVLSTEEIVSASLFDLAVYDRFKQTR